MGCCLKADGLLSDLPFLQLHVFFLKWGLVVKRFVTPLLSSKESHCSSLLALAAAHWSNRHQSVYPPS